jgi:hypothetical protein
MIGGEAQILPRVSARKNRLVLGTVLVVKALLLLAIIPHREHFLSCISVVFFAFAFAVFWLLLSAITLFTHALYVLTTSPSFSVNRPLCCFDCLFN